MGAMYSKSGSGEESDFRKGRANSSGGPIKELRDALKLIHEQQQAALAVVQWGISNGYGEAGFVAHETLDGAQKVIAFAGRQVTACEGIPTNRIGVPRDFPPDPGLITEACLRAMPRMTTPDGSIAWRTAWAAPFVGENGLRGFLVLANPPGFPRRCWARRMESAVATLEGWFATDGHRRRAISMAHIARLLADSPRRETYDEVLREICRLGPFVGAILRTSNRKGELEILSKACGPEITWFGHQNGPGNGFLAGDVFRNGSPRYKHVAANTSHLFSNYGWLRAEEIRSVYVFPIRYHGQMWGTLSLVSKCSQAIDEHSMDLLGDMAHCLVMEARDSYTVDLLIAQKDAQIHELQSGLRRIYTRVLDAVNNLANKINLVHTALPEIANLAWRLLEDTLAYGRTDTDLPNLDRFLRSRLEVSIAGAKQVRFTISVPENISLQIGSMDAYLMLSPLVGNAVQAIIESPRPIGEITIDAIVLDSRELRISVIDDGVGMERGLPEGLLDQPTTKWGTCHGSGCGILCVKRIVECYGGRVETIARRGKPTQISVVLPSTLYTWRTK